MGGRTRAQTGDARITLPQKSIAPGKNKSLKHQTQRVTKGLLNFALVG
jgi:hypothetical protein